jgi:hypothetical protein
MLLEPRPADPSCVNDACALKGGGDGVSQLGPAFIFDY